MTALSKLLPVSMFESLGLGLIQQAADAALGAGVLTLGSDANGIEGALTLFEGQTVNLGGLSVGSQGLSGRLYIGGLDTAPLSATLFDGFQIALTAFDIALSQGGLAATNIGGHLTLPFFTDSNGNPKTLDVEVTVGSGNQISISLSATESVQSTTSDGLVQLQYDLPGGLGSVEIDVASIAFNEANGVWSVIISGNLIIEVEGLNWPSIELRGLGIDSKGNVTLQGGWIDLPNQLALDFFGFHVGLQKLGFGTDPNGQRWIGFNGDINLVEGLSLGGSVHGMVLNLTTGALSFAGVSISFSIPDVISIDGEIDHIQVTANNPQDLINAGLPGSIFNAIAPTGSSGPKSVNLFAGMVKVVITAADDLEVDANFIVGNFGGQSVFFLDLDVELPVGIPIFLDVALYGLQGLVATGLDPNPEPAATWWEWFKYPASNTSGNSAASGAPNFNGTPDYSATDVNKWLVPRAGAFAIGVGGTIGTEADDGYTVSAAVMLVILVPGPVISLIGKANILSKRISGPSQSANFDALATYDGASETFDLTIDAQYQIPVVLDISGTAELYIDANQKQWYFALGKPPHEQRIKARIFDLFESDTYFVIGDTGLITGSWTGYKNSFSFGPLSASVDAYLATLAAIQWSPLQIGGGIQLYGNVHLSAFGIGVGLTADCLLEGCAPSPFWIHGELSVELDLPWPLPNIGATISLTWGGDDGSVPPGPLALGHLDVTLVDHFDANSKPASDHYTLLAHGPSPIKPDLPVDYDPGPPGILDLQGASLTAWRARTAGMLPDLVPDNGSTAQMAPVVPQDGHFTLNFAHPTVDGIGIFDNAIQWSDPGFPKDADVESPKAPPPPALLPPDDMSDINPNPPSVPFLIRHTVIEFDLYQYDQSQSAWTLVWSATAGAQENLSPAVGVTQLAGVWLTGDPSKTSQRGVMSQLKVFPWRLLPGTDWSAQWNAQSQITPNGASLSDQGLNISATAGIKAPAIGAFIGAVPGLQFTPDGSQKNPAVTISFPQPVVLTSLTGLIFYNWGEGFDYLTPSVYSGATALTPQSSFQDQTTQAWTLEFPSTGAAVTSISIPVQDNGLMLYNISWSTAPVAAAILPTAPALYALKTATKIEAMRTGSGSFIAVTDGDPIVEFAYFQTAAGPGTAVGPAAPITAALPPGAPPFPNLAVNCGQQQQPSAAFPAAGSLTDLHTYTQWSWPTDGAQAAYYSYDVNVEFTETYVNALYTAFSAGSIYQSLHFRCTDRNNDHSLLVPNAIHVPSFPQTSALAAGAVSVRIPGYVQAALDPIPPHFSPGALTRLRQRAGQQVNAAAFVDLASPFASAQPLEIDRNLVLGTRSAGLAIQQLSPGAASLLLHLIEEADAAKQVEALWFKPLLPQTRYTLDVVAGPLLGNRDQERTRTGLGAVEAATDAIGLLAALQAFFTADDALTTLQRVQFATSRYATFTAHTANAAAQLRGAAGATPVRHYVEAVDPITWLNGNVNLVNNYVHTGVSYLQDRNTLASLVAGFDPLADDRQPGNTPAGNGAAAIAASRKTVASDWTTFAGAATGIYDGLIAALGRPDLASGQVLVAVPDTEISLFTDASGAWVSALLIESPEPLPWQRIWSTIRLTSSSGANDALLPVWRADGSKGLLVPFQQTRGIYTLTITFRGNIGAEAPCITVGGAAVTEPADIGPIPMGPRFIIRRPGVKPVPARSTLASANALKPLLDA
jgi:hypothetical protein